MRDERVRWARGRDLVPASAEGQRWRIPEEPASPTPGVSVIDSPSGDEPPRPQPAPSALPLLDRLATAGRRGGVAPPERPRPLDGRGRLDQAEVDGCRGAALGGHGAPLPGHLVGQPADHRREPPAAPAQAARSGAAPRSRAPPDPGPAARPGPGAGPAAPPPPQLPGQVVDVAPTNTDKPPQGHPLPRREQQHRREGDHLPLPQARLREGRADAHPEQGEGAGARGARGAGRRGMRPRARPAGTPGRRARQARCRTRRRSRPRTSSPWRPRPTGASRRSSPRSRRAPTARRPRSRNWARAGTGGEGAARPGASGGKPILTPSSAFYDKLTAAPAPDHVEGVDVGDATFLNTREWKFAGFFNRVKQNVAEVWNPMDAARVRDPTGYRLLQQGPDHGARR